MQKKLCELFFYDRYIFCQRGNPKGEFPFGKRWCCCRTKIKRSRDLLSDKQHSLLQTPHTPQTPQTRPQKVTGSLLRVYSKTPFGLQQAMRNVEIF